MAYYMKLIQFNIFRPVTVVETPSFLQDAKNMMNDDEREVLINFLAYNPNAGIVIKGTGGVRKIRWNRNDSGKSSGFRIIYFIPEKFRFLL